MLQTLRISDFAIIAQLELTLAGGFVVFTGETGAGKSIIVDAVQLVLGGRADVSVVRQGAETAIVEAEFSLAGEAGSGVAAILEREGLTDEADRVILAREVRREGRSLARQRPPSPCRCCARSASCWWTSMVSRNISVCCACANIWRCSTAMPRMRRSAGPSPPSIKGWSWCVRNWNCSGETNATPPDGPTFWFSP
jgi:hypothetical protein